MPDFGVSKAIIKGAAKATVKREGEQAADALAKKLAEAADTSAAAPTMKETAPAPAVAAPAPVAAAPAPAAAIAAPAAAAPPPAAAPAAKLAPKDKPLEIIPGTEPDRLTTLSLGNYDLEASHQPNFDVMQTTDDVKAFIADTAQRNAIKIDEARRGVITNEQLKSLASELDMDEQVITPILMRETGGTLNAETILAARQVLHTSADRVVGLAKKIQAGQATDIERLQFRRQIMFHDDFQKGFMGARAEAGRALNAFGIPVGVEQDGKRLAALKQTVDNMSGHDTDQLAAMLSQMDTIEGVNQLTRKYARSRVMGTLQEVFINSLLSGPKTHLVNAGSNMLFQGMNMVETGVAARLGMLLPGPEHVKVGEASAMLFGQLTGFRDALRVTAKSFRAGGSLDNIIKYEGNVHRAVSSANYFRDGVPSASLGAAVDLLGAVIRAPTERVMAPTDEFFKAMAYRAELARQAYLHVSQQAEGRQLAEGEAAEMVTRFMNDPPAEAMKAGEDYATYSSFQDPLGPRGKAAQNLINKAPAGFLIAPFIRTPINVFMAGLAERSPLALFSARFRQAVANGGPERDMALARVSMGTLTVAAVAMAAADGRVTGGGPQNGDARKVLEATGWQPYSIRIDNPDGSVTYQSYARSEPLAYVIGATADTVELLAFLDYDDEMKDEAEQTNNAIAAITAGVANNTMSKTFLQGVADFSEALSDPKRYMGNFLQSTGAALIPYASFRRQAAQMQDPVIREGWTFTDKLRAQSGIPGWSSDAPPRRDVFGTPIQYKGGSLVGIMSPFPDTKETKDAVLLELASVMNETRTIPVAMPGRRVEGMKLTADEYDEMVKISRTEPIFDGNTFKDQLREVMDSSVYALSTPDYRVTLLKQVQEQADRYSRQELEARNSAFAYRISAYRLRKRQRMFGDE